MGGGERAVLRTGGEVGRPPPAGGGERARCREGSVSW